MADQPIHSFSAVTANGETVDFSELRRNRPLVIVFIKKGCPCNVDFEPHFQRIERTYRDVSGFIGVIDGEPSEAQKYVANNHVPYPVLADPNQTIIRQFKAESSAYVGLINAEGRIDVLWPGFSIDMVRALSRRLAELGHIDERVLDLTGLPSALTTGCPFES